MCEERTSAIAVFLLAAAAGAGRASAQTPAPEARWFKGNTHTHTLNSDGDSTPEDVARWYREQRYHFLVLTDHNFVTPVEGLNAVLGAEGRFLVDHGEEITDRAGDKPVHVNALGGNASWLPPGGAAPADALRPTSRRPAAGGLSQVNHPNFGWALTPTTCSGEGRAPAGDLQRAPAGEQRRRRRRASAEALWDDLLSAGRPLRGGERRHARPETAGRAPGSRARTGLGDGARTAPGRRGHPGRPGAR